MTGGAGRQGSGGGGRALVRSAAMLVLAGVAVLPAACSSSDEISTRTVRLSVAPNANGNNALAVDLVLVLDTQLVAQFGQLTATDWFRNRSQLMTANPTGIAVQSFEVIPGQPGPAYTIPSAYEGAVGAFLFAGYPGKDPNRARIDGLEDVLVKLGEKTFTVGSPTT